MSNCPVCGSTEITPFETVVDSGLDITFVMCTKCGMVRQWPRMSSEEVLWYNNNLYRSGRKVDSIQQYENLRAEVQFHLFGSDVRSPRTMLDIGCGTGELLSRFKRYWPTLETWGVEPISVLAVRAAAKGHSVVKAGWAVPDGSLFDLITMSHVLEHLVYPALELYTLRFRCSERGLLYVEVPNLFGDIALEKAHLYAFSEDTLLSFMKQCGWDVIWLKKHGAPKHPTLYTYLSILASPSKSFEPVDLPSPRWVKLRRRLGLMKRMWAMATYGVQNDVDSMGGVW